MPPSRQTRQRVELSKLVNSIGVLMSPCDRCKRSGLECRRSDLSSKCGNCIRRGYSCDDFGPSPAEIRKVTVENERLKKEMLEAELAEEIAYEAQQAAQEAQRLARARRKRLEKLQAFLEKRAGEMIRRGLENIEDLEKLEEQEKLERERDELVRTNPNESSLEPLFAPLSPAALSELGREFPDFFAETVAGAPDNSASSCKVPMCSRSLDILST
jgi:hypothetical protein